MDQKFKPGLCSFKVQALKIYFKLLWGLWQFQRRNTEEVLGHLGKVAEPCLRSVRKRGER